MDRELLPAFFYHLNSFFSHCFALHAKVHLTFAPRGQPLVFTTHSTHKLLAAFQSGFDIHVQDGGARQLDRDRFNEAFMMHISPSPQYSIIASLDVASAMMEGPGRAFAVAGNFR